MRVWPINNRSYFTSRFQIDSKNVARIPPQNELMEFELNEDFCSFKLRTRLNVRVGCQMYFKNYPNDIQICPFRSTSCMFFF